MFPKRDFLVNVELNCQKLWQEQKLFQADYCDREKYMVAFPYPYMNGKLHLGHTFSLSKVDFMVGYQRLKGKNALFPFGFHCTGMPIMACADKLKREVELFGSNFEGFQDFNNTTKKVTTQHGKAAAKDAGLNYQFQIMQSMGIPLSEISKFADPLHWLSYFPPLAKKDLMRFGLHVDWRRSFITTSVNPYYDSFIRWQFNQLRNANPSKIKFGERYTIYSPLDGQACMDHDRSTGEGVGIQEYTGIKLQVLFDQLETTPLEQRPKVKEAHVGSKLSTIDFLSALGSRKLYMVAATLRPETMYGQTNCFVGVDLDYGVFQVNDHEAWICTERAAKNMAWQGLFEKKGVVVKLLDLKGIDLIGLPLSAPLAQFPIVYTLPMENVLATKGTGVVTSVPSDAPDDYITLLDLEKKSAYYNVQSQWVTPFLPPRPIIETPNYGSLAAVRAVEKFKINSQKDKKQLAEAKEAVYKEGFYSGTIIVGDYAGKSVQDVKPLIRDDLIASKNAFAYSEPDGLVISRSGDECIVTLADQWYMDYGEEEWRKKAEECLQEMEVYSEETRNAFKKTLEWLKQWACSRSFGLGSRLPWDPTWLIESLSDSTIYMAYYTVAHLLQGGVFDGSEVGPSGIRADQMTDDVWSYIMLEKPFPDCGIPKETLDLLRREFEYFYPLDLRSSGKDLINNHLTFFLYNHVAVFPKKKWPKAIRANGHLLLNGEKMSKSTGNFLTLEQALVKYGADAIRFALADAGDGLEDANFLEKTADDTILKLYSEKDWIEETMANLDSLRSGELNWYDRVFEAEMDTLVCQADKAYEKMLFREAIKISFYDLQNARNEYRKATTGQGLNLSGDDIFTGMHKDVVTRFIQLEALLLSPVITHWSEYVWMQVLKNPNSILKALWPKVSGKGDPSLLQAAHYVRSLGSKIRSAEDALAKKKKSKVEETSSSKTMKLFVANRFPEWQDQVVQILSECYDRQKMQFNGQEKEKLAQAGLLKQKMTMPFVAMIKKEIDSVGEAAFERDLNFPELETLKINLDYLCRDLRNLKVHKIEIVEKEQVTLDVTDSQKAANATPGNPTYRIY